MQVQSLSWEEPMEVRQCSVILYLNFRFLCACACGLILSQMFLKLNTNSPWVRQEDQRGLELGASLSASIETGLWGCPFPGEGPFLEEPLIFHSGDSFPPSASFLDLYLEILLTFLD